MNLAYQARPREKLTCFFCPECKGAQPAYDSNVFKSTRKCHKPYHTTQAYFGLNCHWNEENVWQLGILMEQNAARSNRTLASPTQESRKVALQNPLT